MESCLGKNHRAWSLLHVLGMCGTLKMILESLSLTCPAWETKVGTLSWSTGAMSGVREELGTVVLCRCSLHTWRVTGGDSNSCRGWLSEGHLFRKWEASSIWRFNNTTQKES